MTQKGPGRPKGDSSNLKAALLATSRELLNEGGPSALSMREVARRTGCTHQAPYHYFLNREALLAALVVEGFNRLAQDLAAACDTAPTVGIKDAIVASGDTYVAFAVKNPGVFRAMFRPDVCRPDLFPDVRIAGEAAYAQLQRLATLAHGGVPDPDGEVVLWTRVHGLALLLLDGPLGVRFTTVDEQLAFTHHIHQFVELPLGN